MKFLAGRIWKSSDLQVVALSSTALSLSFRFLFPQGFYFVQDQLIMHNRAEYNYSPLGGSQMGRRSKHYLYSNTKKILYLLGGIAFWEAIASGIFRIDYYSIAIFHDYRSIGLLHISSYCIILLLMTNASRQGPTESWKASVNPLVALRGLGHPYFVEGDLKSYEFCHMVTVPTCTFRSLV